MTWEVGETILIQEVWRGRLWSACPVTVVEDTPERLVLWRARGTQWKVATTPPSRPRAATRAERFAELLDRCDWVLGDFAWQIPSLEFVRPGDWYAVRVLQEAWGEHRGWYVNLQEPFRRVEHGVQMMDMMLDVVVQPDRQWGWKDEDELELLVRRGVFSEEVAAAVRAAGLAALDQMGRRREPFDDRWLEWKPDASWRIPELPGYWATIT